MSWRSCLLACEHSLTITGPGPAEREGTVAAGLDMLVLFQQPATLSVQRRKEEEIVATGETWLSPSKKADQSIDANKWTGTTWYGLLRLTAGISLMIPNAETSFDSALLIHHSSWTSNESAPATFHMCLSLSVFWPPLWQRRCLWVIESVMIDGRRDGKAERISAHLPIKSRGLEERQAEFDRVLLHLRRGVSKTIVWIRA